MNTSHTELQAWVDEVVKLTEPERVVWCNGSEDEYQSLIEEMLESGDLEKLNQKTHPGCYLHRSDPNDVARTEHLTLFVQRREKMPVQIITGCRLWMPCESRCS